MLCVRHYVHYAVIRVASRYSLVHSIHYSPITSQYSLSSLSHTHTQLVSINSSVAPSSSVTSRDVTSAVVMVTSLPASAVDTALNTDEAFFMISIIISGLFYTGIFFLFWRNSISKYNSLDFHNTEHLLIAKFTFKVKSNLSFKMISK